MGASEKPEPCTRRCGSPASGARDPSRKERITSPPKGNGVQTEARSVISYWGMGPQSPHWRGTGQFQGRDCHGAVACDGSSSCCLAPEERYRWVRALVTTLVPRLRQTGPIAEPTECPEASSSGLNPPVFLKVCTQRVRLQQLAPMRFYQTWVGAFWPLRPAVRKTLQHLIHCQNGCSFSCRHNLRVRGTAPSGLVWNAKLTLLDYFSFPRIFTSL